MASDAEELHLVVVGAHPDDAEIACGGTLAHLARMGYRVGIFDLTNGEPTPRSPSAEVRMAEARRAAEILGVAVRETLDLPNRRLFDCFEARVALAKLLRKHRPKIVVGFGGKTVMASPDHFQAMQITDAAVFYSRLTKWDHYFDGLPTHSVNSQLSFPIGFSGLEMPHTGGHFVADIGDTLDTKLEAVRAYQTQFPPERAYVLAWIESLNRHWGHTAGFRAGEVYLLHRTIGTRDLVGTVSPKYARPTGGPPGQRAEQEQQPS